MTIFVDTSAFLPLLNVLDRDHTAAQATWVELIQREETLVTTSYVLVETFALVQRRLGLKAIRDFQQDVMPILQTHWITASDHVTGVVALLAANRRQLSLVDCTSFHVMRQLGVNTVFAFDQHFAEQSFTSIP
jgi:uncharacterized protein